MPTRIRVRLFWMRPPNTRVWLFSSTTDVSASRLVKRGELIGGGSFSPTSLTSCLTSRATVPCSPIRGITVRMIPASRYSTVWVMEVNVKPPAATGTCCEVTIGTEVETLITAFLFSVVMMDGFDSTLTRFSVASALSAARNLSAANVKRLKPTGTAPPSGISDCRGRLGSWPDGEELTSKRPDRTAHSIPSLVSSVRVTSAAITSIRTCRGILSSFLIVSSISFHRRGYVVTMTALVTSSATKRISAPGGGPSPERPGKATGAPGWRGTPVRTGAGSGKPVDDDVVGRAVGNVVDGEGKR